MINDQFLNNMTALIDTYCEVWNESDLLIRAERLAEVWTLDATYTDPMVHAISSSELLILDVQVFISRVGRVSAA